MQAMGLTIHKDDVSSPPHFQARLCSSHRFCDEASLLLLLQFDINFVLCLATSVRYGRSLSAASQPDPG